MKQRILFPLCIGAIALASCNSIFHRQTPKTILVIEEHTVLEEVPRSGEHGSKCMASSSFSGGHINSRIIDSVSYQIFITSSFDSLVICPRSIEHEVRSIHFPAPLSPLAGAVRQLYYHNHDSVFLMFDRGTVLSIRRSMEDFSDIYLLNREGVIINQYNLDSVPYIFGIADGLYLNLTQNIIRDNLVANGELFLPFYIAYDQVHDTFVINQQIRIIAAVDLATGGIRMLNIPPPIDLHKRNTIENRRGYSVWVSVLNDSSLIYHFPPLPDVFLYDISANLSTSAYTCYGKHFIHDWDSTDLSHKIRYDMPQYIPALGLYFRRARIRDYKDFEPFEVAQFFDPDFNHLGYYFADTTFASFFFRNYNNQLSIRLQDQEVMISVKPGRARPRSMAYIEQNLLVAKPPDPFDQSLKGLTYEERVARYLKNFNLPDDSRIVMYSMRGACSNILSFLMESYRANHQLFGERNMLYLFYDQNIESTMQMISNFNIEDTSYIVADTNRLFLRYFYLSEYGNNPLVRYHNAQQVEVMTYNPGTLYEKFGSLLDD